MDYEKKYKEALERARQKLHYPGHPCFVRVDEIFPELKESEDERIKFLIKSCVYASNITPEGREEIFSWLEKQGEKEADKCTNCVNGKGCVACVDGNMKETKVEPGKQYDEPKFNVGDWIISNDGTHTYLVKERKRGIYVLLDIGDNVEFNIVIETADETGRLWAITDAKDGDVLYLQHEGVEHIIIYKRLVKKNFHTILSVHCAYDGSTNDFFEDCDSYHCITSERDEKEIHPATKEQRDTLFAKMKEAGYKWDSAKKELKKIEPKTLDPDKVVEWLKTNVFDDSAYGKAMIEHFKKDLGL